MSNLNDYYHDDDPRAKQPEVPVLIKCTNCGMHFEESTMVTDALQQELFCCDTCIQIYYTE